MKINKELKKYAVTLLLVFVLGISIANSPVFAQTFIPKPESPMEASLSATELPDKEVNILFTVTSLINAPNTTAEIILPGNLMLISGNTTWNGDIAKEEEVELQALIKVVEEGNYTITAVARSVQSGYIFGDAASLYISASKDNVTISRTPPLPLLPPMEEEVGITLTDETTKRTNIDVTVEGKESAQKEAVISGRFEFLNDAGQPIPIRHAIVRLFDVDDGGKEQMLAEATTNDQGEYHFDPVSNTDEDGTTLDIMVRIYAMGDAANVVNNNGETYTFRTEVRENILGGDIDLGTTLYEDPNNPGTANPYAGAYNIFNTIDMGYRYVLNHGYTPPQATVIWYPGSTDGTYTDTSAIHLRQIDPSDNSQDRDEWDEDVILHEYGHFIQYHVYGEWIPNTGGDHWWDAPSNPNFAFSEGWPTFFGCAIQNDEVYTDAKDGVPVIEESLEDQTPTGEDVEGAVACTLWDIYDPANEPTDQLDLGFDEIWDVLRNYETNNHHVYNIHEFWDGWFYRGHDHEVEMRQIFSSHGMPEYTYPHSVEMVSPTQSNPALAGAFDNPGRIEVTVEVRVGETPITGLTKDNFTIKIGGKDSVISTIRTTPVPGRYILDVTPPQQESPGKYDLEVILNYKRITIIGKEKDAVIYTKGKADVMLIIDRSGSMSGPKIEDAKNSAKLFVDYMREGDKAGIVSFSDNARYDYHLTTLTPEVKATIKNEIDQISASGMTAIGYGLQYGLNDLINYGDPTHSWAMVLLSDGRHNSGIHPNYVLPAIKSQNIRTYTIGLGSDVEKDLMEHIAIETGGKYYYSPTSAQLQEIYNDIVGEIMGWDVVRKRVFTITLYQVVHLIVPVDPYIVTVTFGISWGGSDVDLVLYKPDGTKIDPSVAATDPNIEYVEESTYAFYRIRNPDIGEWEMEIIGTDVPPSGEEVTATVRASSTLSMLLSTDKDQYNQGEVVKITVSLTENRTPLVGADVSANITLPDSSIESLVLYDDGGHGDGAAKDGVYANYFFNILQTGDYKVKATATGKTSSGHPFSRQAETRFKVVSGPSLIELTPNTWNETANAGSQIKKTFTVSDPPNEGDIFPVNEKLYAEYNGTDYLVYNESSIGEEPDYVISSTLGPNPQVSKWVLLTATSLVTSSGDTINSSNVIISPNPIEVPLGGSKNFNVTINIPSDASPGTYSGNIVATAVTGSDSINITLTVAQLLTVFIQTPETVLNDSQFTVTVFVDNVTDLAGFDIFLKYDPTILQYDSYSLGADTQAFTVNYALTGNDTVEIAALTTSPTTSSVTGTDVEILKVTFMAIAEGSSPLEFAAGSNLVQYNASSNQVVVYPGVTFQDTMVTVTNVIPGNLDGDNDVDFWDLVILVNMITNQQCDPKADLHPDNKCDFYDLLALLNIILTS